MKSILKIGVKKIIRKLYYLGELNELEAPKKSISRNDVLKYVTHKNAFFADSAIIGNAQYDKSKIIVGDNTHIMGTLLIYPYGGKIKIGDNCYIGDLSRIWSADKIEIGNDVLISHNVNIIDTNSHEIDAVERAINSRDILTKGLPKIKGNVLSSPIIIKDLVWINFNVTILKGVTIGEGAIVGAGAVVTKDVPEYSFVAGNPAKVIRFLK